MIHLIDTHAHLNFNAYKNDLDEVIKRTLAQNIWAVNVGSKYETSKKAVEIAQNYKEGMYAAIGLHPIYAGADFVKIKTDSQEGDFEAKEENFDKEKYRELAKSEKVVAIGEIGLDYYYRPKTKTKLEKFKEKQKQVFIEQLDLAKELNLPVILHCRMAHQDLLEILKSEILSSKSERNSNFQNSKFKTLRGVVHCFSGNWEEAEEYLNIGLYLGFNGIIYKLDLEEVIKKTPLERILVETDCPYLIPPEARKDDKRNEPIFVKHIIKKISEIKNIDEQKVAETTTLNAQELFNI